MAKKHNRDQLIELGVETLADTLLTLCQTSPEADNLVSRLLATPTENVKRFKDKLASIKRGRRFIDWNETAEFAQELEQLLDDLKAGVQDPALGVEWVARFFELDSKVFERCDDSNGEIGDVFDHSACNLFVHFAQACDNKPNVVQLVISLNQEDAYGVRGCLFDRASEYLPESMLQLMAEQLWELLENEKEDSQKWTWRRAVQSLAKQLKDPALFEKATLASDKIYPALWLEIAEVYLDADEAEIALNKISNFPENESFKRAECNQLLLAIYHQLGDTQAEADMAWQIFKAQRSRETLTQLLEVIGYQQQEFVINDAIKTISAEPRLSYADAHFLLKINYLDALENYLLPRVEQLNGSLYTYLVPLAQELEKNHKYLISSLIYRALIDAILEKAQSKYYHHAVKYLKQLNQIEPLVDDWQTWENHQAYLESLHEQHKRKSAFWSKL